MCQKHRELISFHKKKKKSRLTSECSIPALTVGRRHENKDEEREGEEGRGDSWTAALYASEKEMFSKWLDESFREVEGKRRGRRKKAAGVGGEERKTGGE